MTTRFNKQKLAKARQKKARGGLISGLLLRKHLKVGDASKDDPMVTPPFNHSPAKHPASLTSSLKVIASTEEGTKKKKVASKPFLPTFCDDANAIALKAHEALSVDDLNPLMVKSSSEVMSSNIQSLCKYILIMWVISFGLGFSFHFVLTGILLFLIGFGGVSIHLGKLLDFKKKVATVEPVVK